MGPLSAGGGRFPAQPKGRKERGPAPPLPRTRPVDGYPASGAWALLCLAWFRGEAEEGGSPSERGCGRASAGPRQGEARPTANGI